MKLSIILLAALLAGCNAASYRHAEGNNITLINVKAGAVATVTDGEKTITLDAMGVCKRE
ncbi:hypothetical protein SOASR030_02000 [Leminorella grimontii]|uniref:Lipoprotein n=1 Tax=Leminorella grimontii TaxID=82981 RepID=A0AAV5MW71_9GAMM|nr:hypothetical protein [Leminorella grimontii]GKX54088.1 hypothetical protein SOASR030_02000 [Leminorella grimontii]